MGAGIAGLTASLLLGRDGHDVVLLERDHTPLPASPDAAFDWDRRGAPQVRHSHALLARLRNLLRDHLPDVLDDLLAAGATEVMWQDMVPPTLDDPTPQPGDEDLALIACRRTTLEWVLRHAVDRCPTVELRDGVAATGLVMDESVAPPRVAGLETNHGRVDADVVLDAGGRRSPFSRFLTDQGIEVDETESDTGIMYLSRFYRMLPDAVEPDHQALTGVDIGYLKFAVFRGDNRTFSVTVAVASGDAELRSLLAEPDRFEAALALIPVVAQWVAPTISAPITGIHVMAGLINRIRRFMGSDGPSVLGLHALGDASVCTNPLYGRGCSLGAVHGLLFAHVLAEHGEDLAALAVAFNAATDRELMPWYHASVAQDEGAKKALRGEESPNDAFVRSLLTEGLFPLARIDATVHRAWVRVFNLLAAPDTMMNDEELMKRVLAYWQDRESREPEPPIGPPRDALLSALKPRPERPLERGERM